MEELHCFVLDEMKVKESLACDKYACEVIGFVKMDNTDHQMNLLENSDTSNLPLVATHMLTLMVRGILTNCNFPYAHFPMDCSMGAIVMCSQAFSIVALCNR